MKTITRKQWREMPKDYKSIIDGQKYIMELTNNGTCLIPVKVKEFSKVNGTFYT
jgi:hypothetical protein